MRRWGAGLDPTWPTLAAAVEHHRGGAAPSGLTDRLGAAQQSAGLVRSALDHGVGGLLAEAFRLSDLDVPAPLVQELLAGSARHLRALDDLDTVGAALGPAGIPWVVAKGPVLASLWFGQPFLRAYDDLDVYVAPDRFAEAVAILRGAGASVLDTDEFLCRHVPGEVRVGLATGGVVDLHWQPFFYQVHARRFPHGVRRMLAQSRPWTTDGGAEVQIPSVADGLVHLCLHAAVSGAGRLSWLVDVDRYLDAESVPPEEFRAAVESWDAGMAVAVVLARLDATLGSAPARALLRTLPTGARLTATAIERVVGASRVDGALREALGRAAGSGPLDTATWAGRAALARLVPMRARRAVAPAAVGDYYSAVLELGTANDSASNPAASTGSS